ncbi:MAG: 2-oxo acid dehydrogenase subunit E2 [Planctomycetota bacterium]
MPVDGGFEARKMMFVALAFDQRVVDEFYAAQFLKVIRESLENPAAMTMEN